MEYIYLGDRLTRPELKKQACKAVRRPDGKCIRGKNGNMLVEFENGEKVVVLGRLLRKEKKIIQKKSFGTKKKNYICSMNLERRGVFPGLITPRA